MSLVLGEFGYRVRSAEDGLSALREIRRENPDILLSDLYMPGMSGVRLLSVVRRRFPAILLIAMSNWFSGNEAPSGIPADAFYQKGSSTRALLQILRTPRQMKQPVPQSCRAVAPLWIHPNVNDSSGKTQVAITCPECLMTFSQVLEGFGSLMRQVDCIHCGNSIQCTIVEPHSQMRPESHLHRDGSAIAAQSASAVRS